VKYEIHPAAELFPTMSDEELQGLIADIQANGQHEPATLWCGKLIDGRNRAKACESLGVELQCCELDPDTDPIKWVLSYNLHRRHLTPSQKAMVAVKLKELLEPEAKERKRANGGDKKSAKAREKSEVEILPPPKDKTKSRDQAAAAVGVSGKLVDAAEKVTKKGTPELQAAVVKGDVSVSRAAKIAEQPAEKQSSMIDAPRQSNDEPALKRMIERETEKLVIARWLFDSCTEQQRAMVSVAWSDWWQGE
jgi:ParB-like chromosome segregation protein Spo0J